MSTVGETNNLPRQFLWIEMLKEEDALADSQTLAMLDNVEQHNDDEQGQVLTTQMILLLTQGLVR
jgi:hypothetical protein